MRGEFIGLWAELWRDVWGLVEANQSDLPPDILSLLADHDFLEEYESHSDIYASLYTEVFPALKKTLRKNEFGDSTDEVIGQAVNIEDISNDPELAAQSFKNLEGDDFSSEGSLIDFLENAYDIYTEYDDLLAERYRILVKHFIAKYSLRYEVIDPFQICPTLPGAFTSLFSELERVTEVDPHLQGLMSEFVSTYRDIRKESSESKIKTVIHKMINLLEAISLKHQDVSCKTLGEACKQLNSWPHATVKESLSKLYGFSSDFPGLRHAGNPDSKNRDLNTKDLVSLCIILAGFTPYLLEDFDCNKIYLAQKDNC